MRAPIKSVVPRALLAALIWSTASGCAGHAAHTLQARHALDAGKPADALTLYNKELKVKTGRDLPEKAKGDNPLFVLDRSMISQALADYVASSQDLEYADKQVEILDMSRTAAADIGKYVFSDDSGPYRSAPYEKVMVNTMNMLNYLVRRDLNGARIEARRMSIIQKYLTDNENPAQEMNAPGGYIAGFVFERSGRPDIALRYYDEALAHAEFKSLAEPILRLTNMGSYSTPRLKDFVKKYAATQTPPPAASPSTEPAPAQTAAPNQSAAPDQTAASNSATSEALVDPNGAVESTPAPNADKLFAPTDPNAPGDLLVVINYGRVPAKIAKRIPIGLALTYGSLFMSAANTSTANRLAAQGLVTWINYPDLEETQRKLVVPQLFVDDQLQFLEGAAAIDLATRKAYDKERGKIIASAITRLIARVVVGEAAGAAAKDSTTGAVISILTQATLTAADTPDTRSWSTLPARMAVSRLRLAPGKHKLRMTAQGESREIEFQIEPGGWQAAMMTVLH